MSTAFDYWESINETELVKAMVEFDTAEKRVDEVRKVVDPDEISKDAHCAAIYGRWDDALGKLLKMLADAVQS